MASQFDANNKYKEEMIATARSHIARRIARFCTCLSPEQFESLLDKMVSVHWKYDVLPHVDPAEASDQESTNEGFVRRTTDLS